MPARCVLGVSVLSLTMMSGGSCGIVVSSGGAWMIVAIICVGTGGGLVALELIQKRRHDEVGSVCIG
jgi:hypothetical protein